MRKILFVLLLLTHFQSFGQTPLKPGFENEEYSNILSIFVARSDDPKFKGDVPNPQDFEFNYESPTVGLLNKWYLWTHTEEKLAIISFRGTVPDPVSWLANFYSAMIPAKGELKISEDNTFAYNLSDDPKAAVHVGWTLSLGALAPTLENKMDSLVNVGYQDFIITGHSQGGAIAYLATAHLHSLKKSGRWDKDIRLKTYASAAPKPGNLFFAYHYEEMTSDGWAFNVVNAEDWVPEVPFSVQTVNDFSELNPFSDISGFLKGQKFAQRIVFKSIYNKLDNPTQKSTKNFSKFFGKKLGKQIQKQLPGHEIPEFYPSNHYVRTGNYIVLRADEEYLEKYLHNPEEIFLHHMIVPYYELFQKRIKNNPE